MVTTGRLSRLSTVVFSRAEAVLIVPVSVLDKVGILLDMGILLDVMVFTVRNSPIGAAVLKESTQLIRFACKR